MHGNNGQIGTNHIIFTIHHSPLNYQKYFKYLNINQAEVILKIITHILMEIFYFLFRLLYTGTDRGGFYMESYS